MRRVVVVAAIAITAVVLSAERGWLDGLARPPLIVEGGACIDVNPWTFGGNLLIAHGCGRTTLLYDLESARVHALEFSREGSEHGLESIAYGPNGELGLLAHGGEAVIVNRDFVVSGRFRSQRTSGQAIAWNRGAWEVADFYGITRYEGATGASSRAVEAWRDVGSAYVSWRLGVWLHEGMWRWVVLSYRQDSWASFVLGGRIEVELFEILETGSRRELARFVTRAELNPYSFVTQPDMALTVYGLANNNLRAFMESSYYEIDGSVVKLHARETDPYHEPLKIVASEHFELDATIPWGCDVSAIYVSRESWRRGLSCDDEIRSPRGATTLDRGRLVAEDGSAVELGFGLGFMGRYRNFADPSGNIVIVGETMRRMQIYSPQLELIRDIRFEMSAGAARALWGSRRWRGAN